MADSAKFVATMLYGRNGSFNSPIAPSFYPPEYDFQPSNFFNTQVGLSTTTPSVSLNVPISLAPVLFFGFTNRGSANALVTYTVTSAAGTSTTNKHVLYPGGLLLVGGKLDVTQPITFAGEDGATVTTQVEVFVAA